MAIKTKTEQRARRRRRVRGKVSGTTERPRLAVYRSNKTIYAQIVDDKAGHTLAAADSRGTTSGDKSEQAKQVGLSIAAKAKAAGIDRVVFDRGGYLYHGRVASLAAGAREGGLEF
jgi:large subunit ribosomal protein L18